MTATESQKLAYRDTFRSLHNEAFQSWFESLARALHEPGNFQAVRRTSGDGGLDGFVINSKLVYQVYAPARINELRDSETAAKIRNDFETAFHTLKGSLKEWIFVHNHPEGKIGKLSVDALSELKDDHPDINFGVFDINSLWTKLQALPDAVLDELFGSTEGTATFAKSTEVSQNDQDSTITSQFTRGYGIEVVDFSSRIEDFLAEYLGSTDAPTPFGGRDAEICRLNSWLSISPSPYFLLASQAGMGKSALLVHWLQEHINRKDIHIIFYPVSIRFRTNLASVVFPALASRLAVVHRQKLTQPPGTHPELWRGLVSDYLRRPLPDGESLVLVLDGVDEAADWELGPDLFPASPPKGLRVIVSTRYSLHNGSATSWRKSLGWNANGLAETLDLEPLSPSGVSDVLHKISASDGTIPYEDDFLAQLIRLTAGDPLLLRLYLDELSGSATGTARLSTAELLRLKPGMEGFFARWWDEQNKLWRDRSVTSQPIHVILSLLSCALGPLGREDLLRLAQVDGHLSSWSLDEAMHSLQRLVVGDGIKTGYSFSHSRLNYYFYEKMGSGERHECEQKFLLWGETIIRELGDGTLEPKHAPEYIIQHYGAHLERAHAPLEHFRGLVSEPWLRAWENFDPSYSSFLMDVQRASNKAMQERDISFQIRCALCQSSVVALSSDIPNKLILLCLQNGLISPIYILGLMRNNWSEPQQATILPAIFPLLDDNLKYQLLEIIDSIQRPRYRVEALVAVAKHQPLGDREITLRRAMAITEGVEEKYGQKSWALYKLISALPDSSLNWALELTRSFRDPHDRINPLSAIATRCNDAQRDDLFREVLGCIWQDPKAKGRIYGLARIASYLNKADNEAALRGILDAIPLLRAEIATIKDWGWDGWSIANTMMEAIRAFPDGVRSDALVTARTLPLGAWRAQIIDAVARVSPLEEQRLLFQESIQACRIRRHKIGAWLELTTIADLAESWLDPEKLTVLEEILEAMSSLREDEWGMVLTSVAHAAPQTFFNRCVEIARTLRAGKERSKALLGLVVCASKDEQQVLLREAWGAARTINDEQQQCRVLAALIKELEESEQQRVGNFALEAAWKLRGERQAEGLLKLIHYLSESERQRAYNQIMILLDVIDGVTVNSILSDEWSNMSDEMRLKCLRKLCSYYEGGRNVNFCVSNLLSWAKYLPEEERQRIIEVSRERLSQTKGDYYKVVALRSLATYSIGEERESLLHQALNLARQIPGGHDRAVSLAYHVQHVSESQRSDLINEALSATEDSMNEESLAKLLIKLAAYAKDPQLTHLIQRAKKLVSDSQRLRALIGVGEYMEGPARQNLVQEILFETSKLTDEGLRGEILTLLVPLVESRKQMEIVEQAAYASCAIYSLRSRTFEVLSTHLATWDSIDRDASYRAGATILKSSATHPRPTFLYDLEALLPWISATGGQQSLSAVADAIADTCQWWP